MIATPFRLWHHFNTFFPFCKELLQNFFPKTEIFSKTEKVGSGRNKQFLPFSTFLYISRGF